MANLQKNLTNKKESLCLRSHQKFNFAISPTKMIFFSKITKNIQHLRINKKNSEKSAQVCADLQRKFSCHLTTSCDF